MRMREREKRYLVLGDFFFIQPQPTADPSNDLLRKSVTEWQTIYVFLSSFARQPTTYCLSPPYTGIRREYYLCMDAERKRKSEWDENKQKIEIFLLFVASKASTWNTRGCANTCHIYNIDATCVNDEAKYAAWHGTSVWIRGTWRSSRKKMGRKEEEEEEEQRITELTKRISLSKIFLHVDFSHSFSSRWRDAHRAGVLGMAIYAFHFECAWCWYSTGGCQPNEPTPKINSNFCCCSPWNKWDDVRV